MSGPGIDTEAAEGMTQLVEPGDRRTRVSGGFVVTFYEGDQGTPKWETCLETPDGVDHGRTFQFLAAALDYHDALLWRAFRVCGPSLEAPEPSPAPAQPAPSPPSGPVINDVVDLLKAAEGGS